MSAALSALVSALPVIVPFVGPDALQRRDGRCFRLRMGANESAFGISPLARNAILEELSRVNWYGDPESYELRTTLSQLHGVDRDNVLVGAGIDSLLGTLVRAFLEPGDVAVASHGSYPTFRYHVLGYGGQLEAVPYLQFRNDLHALCERARRRRAKLLYIANPDNPTGTSLALSGIESAEHELPESTTILLDEAYAGLGPLGQRPTMASPESSRIVRLRTFSKLYGLAGLRIGYLVASKMLVEAMNKIRLHYEVNRLAQVAALHSLRDTQFCSDVRKEVSRGREHLYEVAGGVGFQALPSETNFVSYVMEDASVAEQLARGLRENGVFVRVPPEPPLNTLMRITVGTEDQRVAFEDALCGLARKLDMRRA